MEDKGAYNSPCVGLTGRLFGHQFLKRKAGYLYESAYCYRCGMRKGVGASGDSKS